MPTNPNIFPELIFLCVYTQFHVHFRNGHKDKQDYLSAMFHVASDSVIRLFVGLCDLNFWSTFEFQHGFLMQYSWKH